MAKIAIFYNTDGHLSIAAAAVALNFYPEGELQNLSGKDEAATDVVIAALDTGNVYDAIVITLDSGNVGWVNGALLADQVTTMNTNNMISGSSCSEYFTTGGKNTPLITYEGLYSGKNISKVIHIIGGNNVSTYDTNFIEVTQYNIENYLSDFTIPGTRYAWKQVLDAAGNLSDSGIDRPEQNSEIVNLITGEWLYKIANSLLPKSPYRNRT